jgi:hypothetical protein
MWIEGLPIMISGPEHQIRMGPVTRVALFAAALFAVLALAVSPFVYPVTARAYDGDYYEWCKNNLTGGTDLYRGSDFCCSKAGGELSNGNCVDPVLLHPPITAVPTVTQQVVPPVIFQPPP